MKAVLLAIFSAVTVSACTSDVPKELARAVLIHEVPIVDGIRYEGFLACVAIESKDADTETLAVLRDAHIDAVAASECQWHKGGSYHRASGRKAMLVNVYDYRGNAIEFEARHHMKYATMKTLEVSREASGWRVIKVLSFMMA